MLQRIRDKVKSDIQNVTTDQILHSALYAVAVLIILTCCGVFD